MKEGADGAYRQARERWARSLRARTPVQTHSGLPVDPLYVPAEPPAEYLDLLGFPGQYPFTRGIYPDMYRERVWTMRQYAGFGTPEETNRRYRFLLDQGNTGLSVAFDLPTQLGMDSDDPLAEGEVGKVGVAIDTLADMETVFRDIRLDSVSTSFTINATAAIILAMYVAVAKRQGVRPHALTGTVQNDILKEYVARGTWIFPPAPSLRLIVDTIEYATTELPRFNPISIAGAHFRDAGATAVQEAAYTLADGITYVEAVVGRGLAVDSFAPRLSFYFYTHNDFFEEVAKYRAMRRLWARILRQRFGATDDRSCMFRFGVVCGGSTLTMQEPRNNVVRVAYQAMASVLGGAQTIFTCAWDEAHALPTEDSALLALRTQQILAHETNVTSTADPLGGSFYVEDLTRRMEGAIQETIQQIERRGGMVHLIQDGWIQREIAESAVRHHRAVEAGARVVVGLNRFTSPGKPSMDIHRQDPAGVRQKLDGLARFRRERHAAGAARALERLQAAAEGTENLMPPILAAVEADCTVGEITAVLRGVFGEFQEPRAF
ncbi:MAG TPA: methylmalonyl-CoA mutase family protein [Candidatus Methylomirabilis sp.]|nr:methylmalonyl-CoA mutase family protein [Candidatus Methylomirabilis sp.]